MSSRYLLALLSVAILLGGCGIPRDPESTLDNVTGATLRVGAIGSDPWASWDGGEPSGIEVDLVEAFAEEIDAEIEWVEGSESELFSALHLGEIHLVIGAVSSQAPFSKEAALTHPYVTTQTVVGFPEDSPSHEDIAGLEVAVEAGTAEAGMLEKTDAVPVTVDDITSVEGPRVVENWMLDDLGLDDRGVQLDEVDHVMAVPLGENAFMTRLERFLLDNEDLVTRLLEEAQP